MALNNLGMGIVFTASDLASNVIQKVASGFFGLDDTVSRVSEKMAQRIGISADKINVALKGVTRGLAVAAVGVAGLSTAFALAQPAGEFEQKLAGIGAVTQATTKQMMALEDAAIQAGIATQFSPKEAADGLQSLATAGQTAEEATKSLIPVLDLAAGSLGQLGVAGAAEAVVGTLNSYQLEANKAAGVTDKLVRITQISNFQARDFASGLSKAAAAGATFNQSLDDVLVSMGLLRNANIDASSSATAFREATRRLGADQRAQKAVTELGVKVFDEQTGKMRSLIDIITDFDKATKGLTDQQKLLRVQTAFGARGLLAFNAISKAQTKVMRDGKQVTLSGAEAIAELRRQMAGSEGTAGKFRDALLNTFKGQQTLLKGTLETIAVTVGKPFAQLLAPLVKVVVEGLNALLVAFKALPDGVKKAFAGAFIIASIAAIVVGLKIAFVALLPVIKAVGAAMLAAAIPFIKIIAVIALIVAAVMLLKKAWDSNFGGIRDSVLPVLEKIQLAFQGLFALLTKGEITGDLAGKLLSPENEGVLSFIEGFTRAFAVLKAIAVGVFNAFKAGFDRIAARATPLFFQLRKSVGLLFKSFKTLFQIVGNLFGFKQTEDGIDSIEDLAEVVTKGLIEPFVFGIEIIIDAFNTLMAIINAVIEVVNAIASPFIGLAQIIGGAFNAIIGILTGNFNAFFRGITDAINGAVRFLNDLVEKGRAVSLALAPTEAAEAAVNRTFDRLLKDEFTAPEVASVLGASDKTIADLAKGGTKGAAGAGAGRRTGTTTGTAPPNAAGTTSATIPQSTPGGTGQGLSNADVAKIIEAAVASGAANERGRPIVVESVVEVDGEAVGRARTRRERDARAGRGQLSTSIGGN